MMNISTGGPHILLFERDQQLATLFISELQLAGYECHTARTAVEVFDTIARHSIRLVLVDLAQAATARREFWVALDTQRRDRKVQVFTFRCTNLAGYGPHDPDDNQGAMADMDIDGMLGLMSLIDVVRSRIPGTNTEATANTMPRVSKMSPNPQPSMQQPRPIQQTPQQNNAQYNNGSTFRNNFSNDGGSNQTPMRTNVPNISQTSLNTVAPTAQPNSTFYTASQSQTQAPGNAAPPTGQATYAEKIRAVLYPNQRTWSSQSDPAFSTHNENRAGQDGQETSNTQPNTGSGAPEMNVLQRMASGQIGESSLAQLSRMAQGYRAPSPEENNRTMTYQQPEYTSPANGQRATNSNTAYQPSYTQQGSPTRFVPGNVQQQQADAFQSPQQRFSPTAAQQQQADATQHTPARFASPGTTYPQSEPVQQGGMRAAAPVNMPEPNMQSANQMSYVAPIYVTPASRPAQTGENSSAPSLRASPIQDMPLERNTGGAGTLEPSKRPDVLSRANYGQQVAVQSQQAPSVVAPPLASIATQPSSSTAGIARVPPAEKAEKTNEEQLNRESLSAQAIAEAVAKWKEKSQTVQMEQILEGVQQERKANTDFDASTAPTNAVLLDIVQSLPPIPNLSQQQTIQPQVLSGRATRSLGNVLLDGHLVPQERLEVAQNIQRMLRGVDLNYQLGEILLMFKLLTPDQLLAASLVSFGLITTTQISALGRVRQELHAIGLEYDLENLLILFRILTPEQLREARSSLQS